MPSLGRLPSTDERNHAPAYQMANHVMGLSPESLRAKQPVIWTPGPILDQDTVQCADGSSDHPYCTAFSMRAHINCAPFAHPDLGPDPCTLYMDEKAIDGFSTGEGSSVHASAQVLRSLGLIGAYAWAFDEWTVRKWVLTKGPVMVGVNWYDTMFTPDGTNIVHVGSGSMVGGHAFLIMGYDWHGFGKGVHQIYKCQNSWGTSWGEGGFFYISRGDLARLLAEDGEACTVLNWNGVTPQ